MHDCREVLAVFDELFLKTDPRVELAGGLMEPARAWFRASIEGHHSG